MKKFIGISIITPSYNQGEFLAETIESVIGQEGDFVLDYIIADGGSTDNSVEIIQHYVNKLERGEWTVRCGGIKLRWFSEKDKGQTDAIMKGFRLAEGDILAWLNSDDTYVPGAVARVAEFFDRNPETGLLYGQGHYTDERGAVIGRYPTGPFDYQRLAMFNFICQPATFFSRAAYDRVGGLDTGLRYAMDYDLWIRLAAQCTVGYFPEFLATYRLHGASKTMAAADAVANHGEALKIAQKYYGWAPINRVYGLCNNIVRARFPVLARFRVPVVAVSILYAAARYLILNKGIRSADLQLFTMKNMRKLFRDWSDLYKDY